MNRAAALLLFGWQAVQRSGERSSGGRSLPARVDPQGLPTPEAAARVERALASRTASYNGSMLAQRTLKSLTRAVGVGVHGGHRVELTLRPAPSDSGIVFRRVDLPQPVDIAVRSDSVCDTRMATALSPGGDPGAPKVNTVEHLLSACAGLGIDNLVIDITAEEVPILDGSAASFVFLLQSAGIELQDAPKRFLRMRRTVEVREGEGASLKWARLEPFDGYRLTFEIDFDHPAVNQTGQHVVFDMGSGQYKREIARARTFGFTRDVEMMRSRGLGLGGSLDNVVVVDDYKVLNSDGLRYGDEFAKHKILDAIGDLYVIGHPMIGAYSAFKSGHALNSKLVRAVLADPSCYDIVSFDDASTAPAGLADLAPAW